METKNNYPHQKYKVGDHVMVSHERDSGITWSIEYEITGVYKDEYTCKYGCNYKGVSTIGKECWLGRLDVSDSNELVIEVIEQLEFNF